LNDAPVARELSKSEEVGEITCPVVNVNTISDNDNLIHLYSVGHKQEKGQKAATPSIGIEVPFKHTLEIMVAEGKTVCVSALFDGAAMVAAMCWSVFKRLKHRIGRWKTSRKRLCMADGNVVPSRAVWHGKMKLGNIEVEGEFEVFDSKGSWEFLLGKPLLRLFGAKQDFLTDTVTICGDNGSNTTVLHNEITQQEPSTEVVTMNFTANAKQTAISMGGPDMPEPPAREVPQLFETERTNASKTESTDLPQPVYLTAEKGPIQIRF